MNKTFNSIRSSLQSSRSSNRSFRVLVKSRLTHQILPQQKSGRLNKLQQKNNRFNIQTKQLDKQFVEQAKNNLKKYIKNMKTSSAMSHHNNNDQKQTGQFTKRNSIYNHLNNTHNNQKNNSNYNSSNNIANNLKSIDNSRYQKQQNNLSTQNIMRKTEKSQKKYSLNNIISQLNNDQNRHKKQSIKYIRSLNDNHIQTTLNDQSSNINGNNINNNNTNNNNNNSNNNNNISGQLISQRHKLQQLQMKLQTIICQKLKNLSNESIFPSSKNNSYKLLQKQIDRILLQIKQIKQNQSTNKDNTNNNINNNKNNQQQVQINKNIHIIQKKVSILQRLIAQKLFEADNLRNQYLLKLKKQKSIFNQGRSKSNTFYRQANHNSLNPMNYKEKQHYRQRINTLTTNKQSYKSPLKSYYLLNKHQHTVSYNNNKLSQPLPRSSYNSQYLVYGVLPRISYNKIDDHSLFNTIQTEKQKNILSKSLYKEEYSQKVQKQPINYKQLDCYQNKFKSIKVNYGKDKDIRKINNKLHSKKQYQQYLDANINQKNNNLNQINKHKLNNSHCHNELNPQQLSYLHLTQQKIANYEQQNIQKLNLYNQRIKAQIKHKNINKMKYQFNKKLIKSKQENLKTVQ